MRQECEINDETLLKVLSSALDGHRCVQAWLGVADRLFFGLGDTVLPEVRRQEHPIPPFELQTPNSWWRVDPQDPSAIAGEPFSRPALRGLVGCSVRSWDVDLPAAVLRIRFDAGTLVVTPYPSAAGSTSDVWQIRVTSGKYYCLRADGSAYSKPAEPPLTPEDKKELDKMVERLRPRFGPKRKGRPPSP
jgi:hypothetical protein